MQVNDTPSILQSTFILCNTAKNVRIG